MPVAAFANLGCKVNQYETDKMADSFAARGFEIGEFDQPADVYIINTCSVTGAADRKSRQMARRAGRQKPGARVVLTGCFAQLALDTDETVNGAALLVPNREKMRIAEHTLSAFPDLIPDHPPYRAEALGSIANASTPIGKGDAGPAVFPEQAGLIALSDAGSRPKRLTHTRATLKVQDGCEHYCAFCSIPYTRNTMASRSLSAVVAEAEQLAESGVREVVVTGVCVGAYRDPSSGAQLAGLLAAVARTPGLARVRLSSLQPIETGDDLIDVLAEYPSLCPHLHLSLQSGDDTVLSRMQRPYDTAYYRDLIRRLRARIPGIAITTDIIVGFPGETAALFQNTLAFAAEIAFSRTHVFRYSPRERTFAHREYRDDVSATDKEMRHKRLTEVCRSAQIRFAEKLIGTRQRVLIESRGASSGMMAGYTDTYVRVQVPASDDSCGALVMAEIAAVKDGDAVAAGISQF